MFTLSKTAGFRLARKLSPLICDICNRISLFNFEWLCLHAIVHSYNNIT